MSNLEVFNFENQQVRFVGTAGDPWWVAKDICDVLDIAKPENAYSRLDEDEKDTRTVGTPGGNQEMVCINESGLYSLILTSRKPQAKKFKKWVTSEVLPAIRKTGRYSLSDSNPDLESQLTLQEMFTLADYGCSASKNAGVSIALAEIAKLEGIMRGIPESVPFMLPQKEAIVWANALSRIPEFSSSPKVKKLSQIEKYNKVKHTILANLTDEEGQPLSNRAIAKLCGVSHSMVNEMKKELSSLKN